MSELEYTVTEDDLIRFSEFHSAHSPFVRRRRALYIFVPSAILFFIALSSYFYAGDIIGFISFGSIGLIWIPWASWGVRRRLRRVVRKLYREGSNKALNGRHRLRLSDDGIHSSCPTDDSTIRWTGISKIEFTPDYLYIYMTAVSAVIVPRARVTLGDFNQFQDELRSRYSASAV